MQTEIIPASLTSSAELLAVIYPYQKKVEQDIRENIEALGPKNTLRDACEYALLNGGKRFRPIIVHMMARALGGKCDPTQAALGIEYFHTASLVADDLPCMDDDHERRNKPSTHKIYGEATALLVSYALIAAGYECTAKNARTLPQDGDRVGMLALENATYNTGLFGATGGQYVDIFPPDQSLETLRDVIQKKTVSLFEISFVYGWLFGGGDLAQLEAVKKAAGHFGMAFQIADDLGDMQQDLANKRLINMALCYGQEKAYLMFQEELSQFLEIMANLQIDDSEFRQIAEFLSKQASS